MKSKPKKKLKVKPKKKLPAKKPVAKKAAKKKRAKTPKGGWAWIIRSCTQKMRSDCNFKWLARGIVKEKRGRWNPEPICGYGLHGCTATQALGSGRWARDMNISSNYFYPGNRLKKSGWYLICRAPKDLVVRIGVDKVKFPWCEVMKRFPAEKEQLALAYLKKMDAKETSE